MIRMVFADMDGTFLAADKSIPTGNLCALDELERRGIAFVPCTGRPVSAIPPEIMGHAATRYAVGSNGAVVFDVRAGRPLHVEGMDKSRAIALYERVKDLNTTFDIFADGNVYAERGRYEAMGSYGIDEPSLAVLRRVRQPVDSTVPELVLRAQRVEKITCFWKDAYDQQALADAIEEVGGFSSAHGHPKNFELQAPGVSKGFALSWLCEYDAISVADVVAFGDEANDIPMLIAAGDGVAMANATPEVRAAADHMTASSDDAGVARYLFALLGSVCE